MWILAIMGGILLVLLTALITMYNGLVAGRVKVHESFSGMYVQMKRRADLIPNLIETVKGYAEHERETLESVTRLRTQFLDADKKNDQVAMVAAGNTLSGALKSLFVLSERYPDLKASENFKALQKSLEETEDQIAAARRIYNANVSDYNMSVKQFPSNIMARWFSFAEEPFFEVDGSVATPPSVAFTS
ncbi:LemA family protein [Candidatus Kaiserbacteria bacterium]|nr:LemA family protein [Candidatus Kaiserbacteria bacterium]